MVCSQNIAFESWIVPLNLGVELHLEIQAQPFSTKHLLKKNTFDWHVFQQKWQQFPTKNPHQTLPSGRVESLRPEDRLWFETGPRWTLGNVQNLETHQMFHKVFSASSFQIKLSHLYKSESKTPMHNASYFTEYTFIYPVFAFLPAKVKNIMLQSCPH